MVALISSLLIHGVETLEQQKLNPKLNVYVYMCVWTVDCNIPTQHLAQARDSLQTLNMTHAPRKFGKFTIQQRVMFKQPLLNIRLIT